MLEYVRSGRLQFDVVLGRVRFGGTRFGNSTTRSTGADRTEELTTQVTGEGATLNYELSTATETLSIQASADSSVRIRRARKGGSPVTPVDFVQAAGKPLSLTVGEGSDQRVYEAASFWHLLLAEPELSRRHLVPLLRLLVPDADPLKTAADVESELLRLAAAQPLPDRRIWAGLVEQLGDERFARRQRADRKLREAGPAVVSYLRGLDTGKLDAEQSFRVHRIIQSFSSNQAADTAEAVAEWLLPDVRVWLVLLGRDSQSTRRLAADRLALLLGEPVAFDPAAEPATRQKQIDRLRAKIGGQGGPS